MTRNVSSQDIKQKFKPNEELYPNTEGVVEQMRIRSLYGHLLTMDRNAMTKRIFQFLSQRKA